MGGYDGGDWLMAVTGGDDAVQRTTHHIADFPIHPLKWVATNTFPSETTGSENVLPSNGRVLVAAHFNGRRLMGGYDVWRLVGEYDRPAMMPSNGRVLAVTTH